MILKRLQAGKSRIKKVIPAAGFCLFPDNSDTEGGFKI
jgi:hypothetical protein